MRGDNLRKSSEGNLDHFFWFGELMKVLMAAPERA